MSKDIDVQKLAQLARIEVDDKQAVELEASINSVLEFVSDITKADVPAVEPEGRFRLVKNRLRADSDPVAEGTYNQVVMRVAPKTKDGYYQVPKMINKDK